MSGGGSEMTEESDGKIRWVDKDAYVMPVLPESLDVDPLLAALLHVLCFLELSGDHSVDPDWAVEAMEHVAHYLTQLTPDAKASLREQIARVAAHAQEHGWSKQAVELFSVLPLSFE